MTRLPCWLAAILLAGMLPGCAPEPPVDSRIVILGFDGMDPRLAQEELDMKTGYAPLHEVARRASS